MNRQLSRRKILSVAAALAAFVDGPPRSFGAQAQISVGFVTGQTGPGASIGIPSSSGIRRRGMGTSTTIEGTKIKLVQLDRRGDPSFDAQLPQAVEEDKVRTVDRNVRPAGIVAMAAVAAEKRCRSSYRFARTPTWARREGGFLGHSIPRSRRLMVAAVVGQAKGV